MSILHPVLRASSNKEGKSNNNQIQR